MGPSKRSGAVEVLGLMKGYNAPAPQYLQKPPPAEREYIPSDCVEPGECSECGPQDCPPGDCSPGQCED